MIASGITGASRLSGDVCRYSSKKLAYAARSVMKTIVLNDRKVGSRVADGVSEVPRHLGFNSLAGGLLELLGNTEEKTGLWLCPL